jgi:hypothetical protein
VAVADLVAVAVADSVAVAVADLVAVAVAKSLAVADSAGLEPLGVEVADGELGNGVRAGRVRWERRSRWAIGQGGAAEAGSVARWF